MHSLCTLLVFSYCFIRNKLNYFLKNSDNIFHFKNCSYHPIVLTWYYNNFLKYFSKFIVIMRISDLLFVVQFINRSSSIAILMTMEYRMIAMSFLKKKPPMVAIAVRLIPSSCIVNNRLQIYLRKRDIIVNFFFISITNFNFLKRNAKIQN